MSRPQTQKGLAAVARPDVPAGLASALAVSVVIPCYNERDSIRQTADEIHASLGEIGPYEIIFVDDGSGDGSHSILEELAESDPRLRVFHHSSNRGYGAALKSGIRAARGALVAITDSDGTYPAERLPDLLRAAVTADMVVGARTAKNVTYPWLRRIPKFFLRHYCSFVAGQRIPDLNSGFRVIRRDVLLQFLRFLPNGFSFTTTITIALMTNDYPVRFIEVGYRRRTGCSKIRPIRDTLNFVQLILRTATYFAPMRVFFPVAAFLACVFLVSFLYDVIVLDNLTDKTVMFLIFSLQTGMFALVADMIAKINAK